MKANKNLKIIKKGSLPFKSDDDKIKAPKLVKDKSAKKRLSIYDDFMDEDPDNLNLILENDQFDDE
jgi:hypothetical protein